METVEVVIRIPKKEYDYMMANPTRYNVCDDETLLYNHIKEGTVLPKGHGKIIDSKQFFIALNKYLEERQSFSYADLETVINCCTPPIVKENTYGNRLETKILGLSVDTASTIIEADKEIENNE